MSTYKAQAFHPETGIIEEATFIDDFYGRHRYGVKFAGDRVYRAEQVRVPQAVRDRTEDHDSGPNRPRPIIQTAEGFKVDTSKPTIIEAAARAIYDFDHHPMQWSNAKEEKRRDYRDLAAIVLATVTPLIRAAALEEAVQRIEADDEDYLMRMYVAAAIRTLKEQP
jgi:hypothetical protein